MSETNPSEDVNTQGEEVETGTVNTETPKEPELTPEEIAKALEERENYKKAMQGEREEKKTMAEKLAKYEAEEKEREEKEKKKKWQYEELLSEKDKTISELTEKATAWETYQTEKAERVQNELSELLKTTPENVMQENQDILDDLSDEKKITFLKRLGAEKKDFNPESKKGTEIDVNTEYEKAKKEGNLKEMLRLSNLKSKQ